MDVCSRLRCCAGDNNIQMMRPASAAASLKLFSAGANEVGGVRTIAPNAEQRRRLDIRRNYELF
jgi:hypothetical protein